ncbi:DUF4198 domain-containing protein [Asticcacaulis solisilvae]|uniref:DUF4198 domain-containing protein n=1 Tax=Asticcacaulis solisilvae TaxID=1217274 RepID=UPI003FD8C7FD
MTFKTSGAGGSNIYTRAGRRAMSRFRIFCLAAGLLGTPLATQAHDFWLQPVNFQIAPGGTTTMSLQVGHGADRQKSLMTPDRVTRFDSMGMNTGRVDRRGELRLADANADSVLSFPKAGLQVLSFATNGTYSDLPDIRYNDYIRFEGLTPAIELRTRTGTTGTDGKEIYSRRAKALIQVGSWSPKDDVAATTVVGLTLEIVPERNPYGPDFKGALPVRVYYYGKPLPGATVMMNNLQFDGRPTQIIVTDAEGRATVNAPRTGEWQVNVVWTRPIQGDPKADFETTFSSLTFGYAPGSH